MGTTISGARFIIAGTQDPGPSVLTYYLNPSTPAIAMAHKEEGAFTSPAAPALCFDSEAMFASGNINV